MLLKQRLRVACKMSNLIRYEHGFTAQNVETYTRKLKTPTTVAASNGGSSHSLESQEFLGILEPEIEIQNRN